MILLILYESILIFLLHSLDFFFTGFDDSLHNLFGKWLVGSKILVKKSDRIVFIGVHDLVRINLKKISKLGNR